jgi:hypothetical protein
MSWRDDHEPVSDPDELEALEGARIVGILSSGAATYSGAIGFYELVLQLDDGRSLVVEPNVLNADDSAPSLVITIDPTVDD